MKDNKTYSINEIAKTMKMTLKVVRRYVASGELKARITIPIVLVKKTLRHLKSISKTEATLSMRKRLQTLS